MTRPPLTAESLLAHEPFVRAVVRGLVDDDASLNDVVQETWLAALRRPPREGTSLRAWLARVAGNRARDARRAERRRRRREEEAAAPEELESVAAAHERLAAQRELVDAVLALDEPYRTVVFMRYWHGLAPGEIATRVGRSAATVRSQLSRAHEILRGRLDARFDGGRGTWAALLVPLSGQEQASSLGSTGVSAASKLAAAVVAALTVVVVAPIALLRTSGRTEQTAHSVAAAQLVTGSTSNGDDEVAGELDPVDPPDGGAESVGGGASSVGARASITSVDADAAAGTARHGTRWIVRVELTGAPIEDGVGSASMTYAAPFVFGPEDTVVADVASSRFDVELTPLVETPRKNTAKQAAGPFRLRVQHPGILPVEAEIDLGAAVPSEEGTRVVSCELAVEPGTLLRGRVERDGVGLAGAWVVAVRDDPLHGHLASAVSAASGAWSLSVPAPSDVIVVAGGDGLRPRARTVPVRRAGERDVEAIALDPGASIQGHVVAARPGVGSTDVLATLWGDSSHYPGVPPTLVWRGAHPELFQVVTDVEEDATFVLVGLGQHVYELEVRRSEPGCMMGVGAGLRQVEAPAFDTSLPDDIAPRVLLSVVAGGAPVEDAAVDVRWSDGGEPGSFMCTTPSREGRFMLVLEPRDARDYALHVTAPGYEPADLTVRSPRAGDFVELVADLRPLATGTVRVRVRAGDEGVLEGVELQLVETSDGAEPLRPRWSTADPDGWHRIERVPTGACALRVTTAAPGDGFASTWLAARALCTVNRGETSDVEVALEPGGRLVVRTDPPVYGSPPVGCSVLGADGRRIEGLRFVRMLHDSALTESDWSLAPGGEAVVLPALPAGTYSVRLEHAAYATVVVPVTLEAGRTSDLVVPLTPR